MDEIDTLNIAMASWIDVKFERALNYMKYHTEDPTGGYSRQAFPIKQLIKRIGRGIND